jgi:hypothetical protein
MIGIAARPADSSAKCYIKYAPQGGEFEVPVSCGGMIVTRTSNAKARQNHQVASGPSDAEVRI